MKENKRPILFDKGPFKQLFLDFIDYKRGCGLKYEDSSEYTLRIINRCLNGYGLGKPVLTKTMIEDLAKKRSHETYPTQFKRITFLRQFARFLKNLGIDAYIYPEYYQHNEGGTFVPYIFSHEEITAIFKEADNLPTLIRYPGYSIVYPVLVRMLYSCGLRLSEALCLKIQDVDLEKGMLYIDKSKNNKSRFVPMSSTMANVCRNYAEKMLASNPREGYFFPAPDGGRYNRGSVRWSITHIYARAGINKLPNGLYPRVHDIRHTQAVHSMEKLQAKGVDLYCSLPILSAYLGHKGLQETEKYLRLPYCKYDEVALSGRMLTEGMIPEVQWSED